MTLLPRPPPKALPLAELLGGPLKDRHGRVKRKLRVSLTDRCNFRCPYCMPDSPEFMERADRLSRRELQKLLRLFVAELGVTHLRLTGGEPLLRRDLEAVVAECGELRALGLQRISLTTNAALLARRAAGLKAAGLDDLNISLDALTPDTFARLSGNRDVQPVLDGIAAAQAAGLPLKLNAVVVRGVNEDEILPLTRWAVARNLPLRFIEFMPLDGRHEWSQQRVVTEAEILERLRGEFGVAALPRGNDPAAYFELRGNGAHSRIGVIATVSNPFCASCDRLRLTADGKLYPCLFSPKGTALREPLRAGAGDAELTALIRSTVWHKDAGYAAHPGYAERRIAMNALGG
ncbi:MAG TPA: GTP 3',8-cyclase MoaA [Nevskia sp.]|nr:GTP 3',8-cyclase MoaA [Nevskia sp.]